MNSKYAGNEAKAREYFTKMIDYTQSSGWGAGDFPELSYFKALASQELGKDKTEAEAMFRQLITDGENRLNPAKDGRHITTTVEEEHTGRLFRLEHELSRKGLRVSSYYMQGLGYLGLGDKDSAHAFFAKAIEADPLSIDPKLMLEELE